MIVQESPTYKLEVKVQWLDPQQVHLQLITHDYNKRGWETNTRNFFMEPQALSKLADYINDTLCL